MENIFKAQASYVITMKTGEDRDKVINYISDNGFESIQAFDAVVGSNLKNEASNILSVWQQYILNQNLNRKNHEHFSTWGAVGCYLSHCMLWKKMIEENMSRIIIFEDDVEFVYNLPYEIQKRADSIPSNFDVFFMGCWRRFDSQFDPINEYVDRVRTFAGLQAYVISLEGAKKLLEKVFPIEVQIDAYMSMMNVLHDMKFYSFTKELAGQLMFKFSSVQSKCEGCERFFGYQPISFSEQEELNALTAVILILAVILFIQIYIQS